MQYIALKELETARGIVHPGELVPEAATWDRCWFATGHVAAYPEDMVEEVRRHLHTGHMQMHGSEFGQSSVGTALSEQRSPTRDILVVREPKGDPSSGPAPIGPESPLGGLGDPALQAASAAAPAEPKLPEVPAEPVATQDPLQDLAHAVPLPAQQDVQAAEQQPIVADAQGELADPAAAAEEASDTAEAATTPTEPDPAPSDKPRGRLGRRRR